MPQELTKYETARILGARALQVAMNAPLFIKISDEDLEKIKFDALKIAEVELNSGILPISIKKEIKISEKRKEEIESEDEEDIAKEGEIMALAKPEDEVEDEGSGGGDEE